MNEEKQDCGYTEDYCRRGYGCVVLIAALVSLIASLTALALCGAKDGHNDVGNGWAIGILGTLLTFAVAWNIWQVIDTKNTVRKAEESSKKLKKLEQSLETQRNIFNQHNLEIKRLIEAHAKIFEADKTKDLANKYIAYAEAFDLLLQSNVGADYEQFDNILGGLSAIIGKFAEIEKIKYDDARSFIDSEELYNWHYKQLTALLDKRSDEIDALRRKLSAIHDLRKGAIEDIRNSDIGKRIQEEDAEIKKHLEQLEAKRSKANKRRTK